MWLLSWVPDSLLEYLVNGILVLGIVSTFLTFFVINRLLRWFPPLARWVNVAQIISAIILLAGVYFKGSFQTESDWRTKVADAQAQVDRAEREAREANEALAKKTKEKIIYVKEKGLVIKQYLDRVVTQDKEVIKFVEHCPIPGKIIETHNAARSEEHTSELQSH